MGRESEDCPRWCPCGGQSNQTFEHWILECSTFSSIRCSTLHFINDLFVRFSSKVKELSLINAEESSVEFVRYINYFIYMFFFFGGILVFNELQIDKGERRHLSELFIKGSSEVSVPYIVGFADFLSTAIPVISSSFELLFNRFLYFTNLNQERRRRTDKA